MKAFYSDHFVLPLPPGHRFPMVKYRLLREALTHELPAVRMLEAPAATDGEDCSGQAGLPEFGPRLSGIGGDPQLTERHDDRVAQKKWPGEGRAWQHGVPDQLRVLVADRKIDPCQVTSRRGG